MADQLAFTFTSFALLWSVIGRLDEDQSTAFSGAYGLMAVSTTLARVTVLEPGLSRGVISRRRALLFYIAGALAALVPFANDLRMGALAGLAVLINGLVDLSRFLLYRQHRPGLALMLNIAWSIGYVAVWLCVDSGQQLLAGWSVVGAISAGAVALANQSNTNSAHERQASSPKGDVSDRLGSISLLEYLGTGASFQIGMFALSNSDAMLVDIRLAWSVFSLSRLLNMALRTAGLARLTTNGAMASLIPLAAPVATGAVAALVSFLYPGGLFPSGTALFVVGLNRFVAGGVHNAVLTDRTRGDLESYSRLARLLALSGLGLAIACAAISGGGVLLVGALTASMLVSLAARAFRLSRLE